MKYYLRLVGCVFLFSGWFTLASAAETAETAGRGTAVGTVIVPEGLSADTVQKAILLGGSGRGWTVKAKKDGEVVLFLEQDKWRSTITLTYTDRDVALFSNSAKGKKTAIPENWINYLKQDITKQLGMAAYAK